MAQSLLRRFRGPKKTLNDTSIGAWAPVFAASEIDPASDGTFVANDLGVTMEFTNDPGDTTAKYMVTSGGSKMIPLPGMIYWRVQDPNRARTVTAQQVQS